MDLRGDKPLFFATDLTNFIGCRHLTVLERLAACKLAKRPFFDDPMLEILRERGLAHEQEYVRRLARSGKSVVEITRSSPKAFDETLAAMREGADVVVQGRLEHGSWAGWADVLLRVDGESRFGSWRYEPVETKLAKTTRGATLIQLCLYADLLAELQGASPEILRVVVPDRKFKPECYRFDEFRAYYRLVRRNLETEMNRPLPASAEMAEPYPDPVAHCDICNWYALCEKRWTKDDHLSLVAGIKKTQRKELASWGITTLAALAEVPLPLPRTPSHGSAAALERVREQARLQFEARTKGRPVYELLPIEKDQGLAALPVPSPLDIFLDLEGDRQGEHGGLDYLFGYALRDADGGVNYEALWAMSPAEERRAFERIMDIIVERRQRDPGMHVFHYASYEPTSMKRLMGRYGTRADELDDLLRAEVFVDLYGIVRKALRAGIDSYSIKKLEPFYGLAREIDLRKVTRHLRAVEYAIAMKESECLTAEIREAVRSYNRDDCISALELRDWLERLRLETEEKRGEPVPRPPSPLAKLEERVVDERLARIRAVSDALTAHLPLERNRPEEAQWTLAQLLEWHRREDKVDWWEFFRLNQMTDAELLDEPTGIAGLIFERRLETTKRGVVVDRYRFPPQDTEFEEQDDALAPGSEKASPVAKVEAIDLEHRTIDLRKGVARADLHPTALFKHERVSNPEAVDALLRLGEFVRDHGIDVSGSHRAARDLLLRRNPRLIARETLRRETESTVVCARRVVLALDGGVLAIQGPPGAGKTFTAARMIVDLVRGGKKVGVTAVSHKVIRNLLEEVVRAAADEGVAVRCMHRVSDKSKSPRLGIDEETDAGKAVAKIRSRAYDVVGGTAWVWSKEDLAEAIDVLVVDEAGQMSLANVLACAQAARNLVLLGDPQQLEQPQKASHPIGSELSALEYLLEGHETMPEERGLFLGETWRLHPSICSYTSELFYEGKLRPHPGLAVQAVAGPTPYAGAGLFYAPVVHDGNQNSSAEEAERVAEIVKSLLCPGVMWVNRHGEPKPLTLDDILIVAPYNAQVSEIAERVPGARIGTVDKFQGQEAPIVIYSMATSSPEEAPHGMDFLFSRHRLNVATSRARCVCILVGNPELFEPECRTPEQMRMANAFCRYLELARTIE
ncbi:MAG TPA: TM0106 family RecB-like putative nuclease [Gemmatimonadaceae bacterium]